MPDALQDEISPFFPAEPARPKDGRPPLGGREALTGLLFVLSSAIGWERLPFEVAGCSGLLSARPPRG